ncbi:lactosylceramide 4-alpha-galactosyltransferase-like [Aethina tumida]|uniref:lactosylceramide 4-alpha-galactosyltransferase-like n=1 Tax=Aethina tumida TaxID=116153 RepID=UPI002148B4D0|nr:lactosylceramide 4-alpha-galactosyltransferase-like [Aethina tumida]
MLFILVHKRGILFVLLILFILLTLIYNLVVTDKRENIENIISYSMKGDLYCYSTLSPSLEDILEMDVTGENSIFFWETSCNSQKNGKIILNPRQACAVESAAKMNPGYNIYLIYVSPGQIKNEGTESDRVINVLLSYKNIHIVHINIWRLIKGSPVENLFLSGKLEKSKYPITHASDIIRFLTMWKFGGIYLDLDMIFLKSFKTLPKNFGTAESTKIINSAVMGFENKGLGLSYVISCLNDLNSTFNGQAWGYNGPDLITRFSERKCKTKNFSALKVCEDYTVLPQNAFHPIPWNKWQKYFNETYNTEVRKKIKNSYGIHVWNKNSIQWKLSLNSNATYMTLAKKFCPNVIKELHDYF